jgi:hypothetical protein
VGRGEGGEARSKELKALKGTWREEYNGDEQDGRNYLDGSDGSEGNEWGRKRYISVSLGKKIYARRYNIENHSPIVTKIHRTTS